MTWGIPPLWIAAVGCFASCVALGFYVRRRAPTRIDLSARALRGAGTPLAATFTMLGRWYGVLGLGAAVAASAVLCGSSPMPIFTLLASQIVGQGAVGGLKRIVQRVRPDFWLVRLERDLSYPSGHSATAIVFFVPLVALTLFSHIVPEVAGPFVASGFALCIVGLPWSRLALGAHYATDVIGGLLFGIGWLCATTALLTMR